MHDDIRPEDEDYLDWCENHPCMDCNGEGVISDDGFGDFTCSRCQGSGLDPESVMGGES